MATKEQVQSFIKALAALAQAERAKRDKWVLPSVCIAQAALETVWGTSALMTKANAYFGIKATDSWAGKVYNANTRECFDGVSMTDVTACFRAYDSVADSVADYFDLITGNTRYAAAVNNSSPKAAITAIYEGGYATDPGYVTKVMAIITLYQLTKYDKLETTTTTTTKGDYTMEMRNLKKGHTGDDVKALQILLIGNGYSCGSTGADGNFGSNTETAVKKYQTAKGLTVDGIAGKNTMGKLLGAS